ncbi:MAG: ankyrin repeat domain-containing protein [Acidobacteria bacterium]|nr:ankyrin repeat domain-containing protein [Acidobacteriota bacterium]
MKLLLAAGADHKLAAAQGTTPLMVASGLGWMANHSTNAPDGWLDAAKLCVEQGADLNAADSRGYTALHGAAYIGHNDLVTYLVSKGAKVDAKTKAGDTVADMANGPTRFGLPHPETLALLEKLGSVNSHNCRSDQCIPAAKPDPVKPDPAKTAAPAKAGDKSTDSKSSGK